MSSLAWPDKAQLSRLYQDRDRDRDRDSTLNGAGRFAYPRLTNSEHLFEIVDGS